MIINFSHIIQKEEVNLVNIQVKKDCYYFKLNENSHRIINKSRVTNYNFIKDNEIRTSLLLNAPIREISHTDASLSRRYLTT